jgi:hypothetical protein
MWSSVFSKSVPDKFPIHPDIHQYPAYDSFLKLVQQEAEQHVKRLRHHPSLVVFGGCAKKSFGLIFILSRYFFRSWKQRGSVVVLIHPCSLC